jgi:hypothetical protein
VAKDSISWPRASSLAILNGWALRFTLAREISRMEVGIVMNRAPIPNKSQEAWDPWLIIIPGKLGKFY